MPRRATLCLLTCILALVTGVALLFASAAVGGTRLAAPSAAATATTVRAFYDAVNAGIETGNVTDLDAVVAADFVAHAPLPGTTPDRAGLAHYLHSLHATQPGTEVIVEEIVVVGDRALVWVAVRGTEDGTFLGVPVSGAPVVWGSLDAFRVAERRIVEHWGGPDGLIVFEPLGQAPLDRHLPPSQGVAFERHAWLPGEHRTFDDPDEARLHYVEMGTLTVAISPNSPRSALLVIATEPTTHRRPREVAPGTDLALAVGDILVLPKLTRYTIGNEATSPATALVAAVFTPGALDRSTARSDPAYPGVQAPSSESHATLVISPDATPAEPVAAPPPTDGVIIHSLAGDKMTTLPPGPATMALGSVTLAPGVAITLEEAAGPVLFSIEAGELDLEVGSGTTWVRRGANGASSEVAAGTLMAGDGALLQPFTPTELRNNGDAPLVIVVLTLMPDPIGS